MRSGFFLLLLTASTPCFLQGQVTSPAAARVRSAEKRVASDSKSWEAYNDLAFALCRLARDIENIAGYERAELAVRKSLELSPGNYDARKLMAVTLIGKHDYERARSLALELNHRVPDDIAVWGLLVDIHAAYGSYREGERAAQWILDLRRASTLGFVKAAGLREIFGDYEGAAEFYEEAIKRTARSDLDEQSWLLVQEARQFLSLGRPERTEDLLKQATSLFPDSQLGLAGLAELRSWQGKYSEASSLLERKYRTVNNPGNLYEWAEALDRSGQKQQAAAAFQEFDSRAREANDKPYNWNRELIYYYCDRKANAAAALRLAERELKSRQDWPTMEAHAWALYKNGRYVEAEKEMNDVSAIGVRNSDHLCRAAQIAQKANDFNRTKEITKELADLGVHSCEPEYLRDLAFQPSR